MKSVLRLAILLIGTVSSLRAQGWTGGFKAGLGQGGFTGRSEFAWSATGMNIAAYFSRPVRDRLSFQPEISATQKIGQSAVGGSSLTFTGDDINLPMLLRLDFPPRREFTPFVVAGPSLSFRAGCSLQLVVAGQVSNFGCEEESFLSRTDFGLIAGGGVSRMIGATTLTIEARTNLNLRSVAVPDGSGFGHSVGWAIMAGASMPLRRAAADSVTCNGRGPCQRPPLVASQQ
jgi:hypothetical protein